MRDSVINFSIYSVKFLVIFEEIAKIFLQIYCWGILTWARQ